MEEGKPRPERVKINVGGTAFETLASTLTKFKDSVLCDLVGNRSEEELFIDRDPTYFSKILNYMRDPGHFKPPLKDDDRENLYQEAEFYKLPGLVKLCSPEVLQIGDKVVWSENAKELFCNFARVMSSTKKGSLYDTCDECGHTIVQIQDWNRPYPMNFHIMGNFIRFAHLNHMSSMKGTIMSHTGSCWQVRWTTGFRAIVLTDISKSARLLKKAK